MMAADLFGWEAVQTAQDAVAHAHAHQVQAQRRVFFAPHGQRREREAALKAATAAALQAEADLIAARREANA